MRAVPHWVAPRPSDHLFDAWLKRELGREHDGTLNEKLPDEWLDLLGEEPEPTRH